MKLLIYADPHFSQYSSIVRGRGNKYSKRLENLITSINWVEEQALICGCDSVICLGDFFDKETLNSEELTALQEIQWSGINHVFLVGNHEMGLNTLEYSSAHLFKLAPSSCVVDKPEQFLVENTEICFLPYILESKRKTLSDYFGNSCDNKKRIILSHNDIKGFQLGAFISKEGFDISEINDSCDIFFNGHLHNGGQVAEGIINIGNITGQNFSEDALNYPHRACIVDTDTLNYNFIENPHAFNFYKLGTDVDMKSNAVVTVRCSTDDVEYIRAKYNALQSTGEVITFRIIVEKDTLVQQTNNTSFQAVDHIQKFKEFIFSTLGADTIINEELSILETL